MIQRRSAAVFATAMLAASCVQFTYAVQYEDNPVPDATLAQLMPGVDDLSSCLSKLGAPHHVFEYRYDGLALLWHHVDSSGWGARFSMSVVRGAPGARFSMDSDSAEMPGAMLWFDGDYKLVEWRKGMMRDLTAGFRRRPADLDQQDRESP